MLWMIIITAEPPYWRRRWIFITLRPELGRRWTKNGIRWGAIMKRKSKTWLNVCRSPCSIITRGHCWLVVGNKTRTESVAAAAAGDVVRSGGAVPCVPALAVVHNWQRALQSMDEEDKLVSSPDDQLPRGLSRERAPLYHEVSNTAFAGGRVVLINKLIHRPTIGWPPATADL